MATIVSSKAQEDPDSAFAIVQDIFNRASKYGTIANPCNVIVWCCFFTFHLFRGDIGEGLVCIRRACGTACGS